MVTSPLTNSLSLAAAVLLLLMLMLIIVAPDDIGVVEAGTNNRYASSYYGKYQQSGRMAWTQNSASLSYQVKGCVWATTSHNEDFGCLANSSGDGVNSWFKMANCRRAQVTYNVVYGSDSSSTQCKSSYFKESVSSAIVPVGVFFLIHGHAAYEFGSVSSNALCHCISFTPKMAFLDLYPPFPNIIPTPM
jgi:hypothetical protein